MANLYDATTGNEVSISPEPLFAVSCFVLFCFTGRYYDHKLWNPIALVSCVTLNKLLNISELFSVPTKNELWDQQSDSEGKCTYCQA